MKRDVRTLHDIGDALERVLSRAHEIKSGSEVRALAGKSMALLFMNPSLRTRVSFESLLHRFGAKAIAVNAGSDSWGLETRLGVCMNEDKPEHIADAARVLSRYVDCIGLRSFGAMKSFEEDCREETFVALSRYASVPVVNLESAMSHPCQALGDMLTMREHLKVTRGKTFVLSWAPHIKPLPLAVPCSSLRAAALSGMNVRLSCPAGYEPGASVLQEISGICELAGTNFEIMHDRSETFSNADIVMVKSWGSPALYGQLDAQQADFKTYRNWCVRSRDLDPKSRVMHCLPVRRNVVLEDSVIDGAQSIIFDQAENRLWAQAALLEWIFSM